MATTRELVTGESQEVALQSQRYANAIGGETMPAVIQEILSFAADATLPPFYAENQEEDLWYEMLEKDGLLERVGGIADDWNEANIQRAEEHIQRRATVTGPPMIKKFGFCRFKATPATEFWSFLEDGPGVDESGQTIVFIALEDLGPHNGFPFDLRRGQDVCMDGNVGLWTPPTGGGLAIFFSLNL